MTSLKKKEVKYIASLANLDLSEEEVKKFKIQLSEIINYIHKLKDVNTQNVEPTSQTTGIVNNMRQDSTVNGINLSQDEALSGTDSVQNGYFKVPLIFSKDA